MEKIDDIFISHASDILADTNSGLSQLIGAVKVISKEKLLVCFKDGTEILQQI